MARRWAVAAIACLGTTLLAGCSGGSPQPSAALPPTSSQSATAASPALPPLGPTDFPVPAAARKQTAEGATGQLRYYLALVARGPRSNEYALRDLSRDCTFCSFLADRFAQDAASGYRYSGGAVTLDWLGTPAIHDSIAEFTFTASQEAIVVLDRSSRPVTGRGDTALEGLKGAAAMVWDPSRDVWLLTQLAFTRP